MPLPPKTQTKICPVCGALYPKGSTVSRREWGRSKFCSRRCLYVHKVHPPESKVCQHCRQTFVRPPRGRTNKWWAEAKFCSPACWRLSVQVNGGWRKGVYEVDKSLLVKNCEHCGRAFQLSYLSQMRHRFCSLSCRSRALIGHVLEVRQYPKPNKKERKLLKLLGPSWLYVGDGQLTIGGKSPDFWNGDHKLIELFGDYWHRGENPQPRIDHFARQGYNTLVIWESELANPELVKAQVADFAEGVA